MSVTLSGTLGYFTLLAAAAFILVAAALSFVPNWSPSDFPLRGGSRVGRKWRRLGFGGSASRSVRRICPAP